MLNASKRLDQLNRQWAADGKPEFRTRFGLHRGEMIVGNVGAADRPDYTVLGDAVNLASRLEGLDKDYGTRICVSRNLYDRISESHLLRPLDVVAVKGRRRGMLIYELMARRRGDPDIGVTDAQIVTAC